jgi:hypothetical protein
LERCAPRADVPRVDIVGKLNTLSEQGRDGLDAINRIRKVQQWPTAPRSNFDFSPSDPGNVDGSRFGHTERYDPPRVAGKVPDAAGKLRSGNQRARDHWSSGDIESIDPAYLLESARMLIAAARAWALRFPEGRRV